MADQRGSHLSSFSPEDTNSCAGEWEHYKRKFEIHLEAKGLHAAEGRRKVANLLECMGGDHFATYDTFDFAPAIPAIAANAEADPPIVAVAEIPGEDRYDLTTVFQKFDDHFGVHRYRVIKRQQFLNCNRKPNQSVQAYIVELKQIARQCDYGDKEEGIVLDMVINKVNNKKISERLMEQMDKHMSLDTASRICRQVELTDAHVNALDSTKSEEQVHYSDRQQYRARGGYSNRQPQHQDRGEECDRCCTTRHSKRQRCPAQDQFCGRCGKMGHFMKSPRCSANREDQRSDRADRRGMSSRGPKTRGRGNFRGKSRGGRYVYYADKEEMQHRYDDSAAQYDDVRYNDEYAEMCTSFDGMSKNKYDEYYVKTCVIDRERNNACGSSTPNYNKHIEMPVLKDDDLGKMFDDRADVYTAQPTASSTSANDYKVTLSVLGRPLVLEIDTGAKCNILSLSTLAGLKIPHNISTHNRIMITGVHGKGEMALR